MSLGLYVASLLLVVGCGLLAVRTGRALFPVITVWAAVLVYYGAGLVLFRTVARLRAAAAAMTGTGLAVLPFAGLVTWRLPGMDGSWTWLLVSAGGTVLLVPACRAMDSRVLAWLCLGFLVSDALATASTLGAGLVRYFVALSLLATVLGLVALLAPSLLPRRLEDSVDSGFRWIVPAAAAGTLLVGHGLRAPEVCAVFTVFSAYAAVFLALGRAVPEYVQLRVYPLVTVTALGLWAGGGWWVWFGLWAVFTAMAAAVPRLPLHRLSRLQMTRSGASGNAPGVQGQGRTARPVEAHRPDSGRAVAVDQATTAAAGLLALAAQLGWLPTDDAVRESSSWTLMRLAPGPGAAVPWWVVAAFSLLALMAWSPPRRSRGRLGRRAGPTADRDPGRPEKPSAGRSQASSTVWAWVPASVVVAVLLMALAAAADRGLGPVLVAAVLLELVRPTATAPWWTGPRPAYRRDRADGAWIPELDRRADGGGSRPLWAPTALVVAAGAVVLGFAPSGSGALVAGAVAVACATVGLGVAAVSTGGRPMRER